MNEAKSLTELGKELGIHPQSLNKALARHGIWVKMHLNDAFVSSETWNSIMASHSEYMASGVHLPDLLALRSDTFKVTDQTVGVYFLFVDNELIYVGQTTNLFLRLLDHFKSPRKFTHYAFLPTASQMLDEVEYLHIDRFKPKKNIKLPTLLELLWFSIRKQYV